MNFHKAKILLEKINRLHSNMSIDQDHINSIEKDLMLNYVREYYEIFYWDKQQSKPATIPRPQPKIQPKPEPVAKPEPVVVVPKPKPIPPKPKPEPVVVVPKPKPVVVVPPTPKPEPVVVIPPTPKPTPKPEVIKIAEVVETVSMTSTPAKKVVVEKPKPKKEPVEFKPAPKITDKTSELDPESEALFETTQAKELSEKLGLSPIMDLNKAFGLNDRMLYTNELFNGDNNVYKETMAVLNSFNSLDQAKVYLIENVAGKYSWTSKNKKKQAKEFIKTIGRKYV